MISDKMQQSLNEQLHAELESAYIYLSMSAYCSSIGMHGFAHWMQVQAGEEMGHAKKFYGYIEDQLGRVKLLAVEEPPFEYKSITDVVEKTLAHERKITKRISQLVKAAKAENDYATDIFLQWFVTEQVEEENNVQMILERLKMIGDKGAGLFILDKEMGSRAAG
jgi:ferritin